MGQYMFDQYTLLHFASGIIAYFWGLTFMEWIILHTIFELIDNSDWFIYLVNHWITVWPGGKHGPDSMSNKVGDTIGAGLGWFLAMQIDSIGEKWGLYPRHISNRSMWSIMYEN